MYSTEGGGQGKWLDVQSSELLHWRQSLSCVLGKDSGFKLVYSHYRPFQYLTPLKLFFQSRKENKSNVMLEACVAISDVHMHCTNFTQTKCFSWHVSNLQDDFHTLWK